MLNFTDQIPDCPGQFRTPGNPNVDSEKCEKYDAFVLYIHTHGVADTILCNNSCIKIENNETTLTNVIHFNQIT